MVKTLIFIGVEDGYGVPDIFFLGISGGVALGVPRVVSIWFPGKVINRRWCYNY